MCGIISDDDNFPAYNDPSPSGMMGQSSETLGKLPLTSNAAPPAGFSAQSGSTSDGNSRSGVGGYGYGYGGGEGGYSTAFDDAEDDFGSTSYGKAGYPGDSSKKQPSDGKGFDEQDEFENVDALDWDFTASGPQAGASWSGGQLGMSAERGKKSLRDRFRSFDPTFGLGTGSLSDIIPVLPFTKRSANAPGDPRTIYLNDTVLNGHGRGGVKGTENQGKKKWQKNGVSTGKYNIVTFIPKFLFGGSIWRNGPYHDG